MKKKGKKSVLDISIKYFYTVGFTVNIGVLIVALTFIFAILFTDKSNIIQLYEKLINSASMSENLTWFFYLMISIITIMNTFILNLISVIVGIMGYKLKNRILKTICVVLNIISFGLIMFIYPLISYFIIPLFVAVCCLIFGLYLEKKQLDKEKKTLL